MAAQRRSESDMSDYEEADEDDNDAVTEAVSPSAAEINKLRTQLGKKCSVVNDFMLSSRAPVEKRKMVKDTLHDLLSAFNYISGAYERLNTSCQTLDDIKSSLVTTIRAEISTAFSTAQLMPQPLSGAPRSYANVTARNLKQDGHRVKISNGPTVIVPDTVSFVIGPKKDSAGKYTSAEETKKAVMKAVNPRELSMKVSKVLSTRNNGVRIIAEEVDMEKIQSSPTLSAAGLEVKVRERLNPRLIIRGVPTDKTSDGLLQEILSMNKNTGCTNDNLKIIYRYPPRDNKLVSSVVIETSSDVRREILKQGRIYLSWVSCMVGDHLRVLQCFNCLSFGHLAKNCNSQQVCGHCSGSHNTSACPNSKATPTCHNCTVAKHINVDHRAFDAQKCQTIKFRLTEKAKYISY